MVVIIIDAFFLGEGNQRNLLLTYFRKNFLWKLILNESPCFWSAKISSTLPVQLVIEGLVNDACSRRFID
jgi:hypothetical protein